MSVKSKSNACLVSVNEDSILTDKMICKFCGIGSPNASIVNYQFRNLHKEDKNYFHGMNYFCSICDETFVDPEELKYHKKLCHLEKP